MQVAPPSAPAEVPVELESHHNLVLMNQYLKLYDVQVAPHQETEIHRHKYDYLVVTIGDADVTNAVVGKQPQRWPSKDGAITFIEARGPKSFAHKAVNESGKRFHNYTIELLRSAGPAATKSVERCAGGNCERTVAANAQFACTVRSTEKGWWLSTGPYDRPRLVVSLADGRWMPPGDKWGEPFPKYTWKWLRPGEKGEFGSKLLVCAF